MNIPQETKERLKPKTRKFQAQGPKLRIPLDDFRGGDPGRGEDDGGGAAAHPGGQEAGLRQEEEAQDHRGQQGQYRDRG